MKKVFNFIAWKYRQYDIWQKLWFFSCFWLGAYITAEKGSTHEQVYQYLFIGSLAVVFFKWFIWDMVKSSWDDYNKEQEKIVDILRDGPK
jgi:hypothetical protein